MGSNWTDRRVVITGLGVVSSLGHNIDTFWQNLLAGQCGIDKITLFDAAAYDCQIAAEVKDFNPGPAFPSPNPSDFEVLTQIERRVKSIAGITG